MQARRRRVKTAVERDRARIQSLAKLIDIGRNVNIAAPLEFIQDVVERGVIALPREITLSHVRNCNNNEAAARPYTRAPRSVDYDKTGAAAMDSPGFREFLAELSRQTHRALQAGRGTH